MSEIKIKIKPQKIANYLFLGIILIILAIIYFLSHFLYTSFYQTISQSKDLLFLKKEVASEMIDIKKYNEVIDKINKKTAGRNPGNLQNPFGR